MPRIRLTIFRKGLLLISLPLLFQLVLVAILIRVQHDAVEADQWAAHSKDVLSVGQNAINELASAQGAERGLVITGDVSFDEQCKSLSQGALGDLEKLVGMVADNPAQQAKVQEIHQQGQALAKWLASQSALVLTGRREEAVAHVRDFHGVRLFDTMQKSFDDFYQDELRVGRERAGSAGRARSAQSWALGVTVAISTIVTCVAVYIFGTSIASRVAVATRNARLLADNEPLLAPVSGTDEIALLDAAMHDAARRLAVAGEAERTFKKEIERRADDLARANESLRQQTQENEMFVYSVSHDLRSPLVNLQGFSRELVHAGDELKQVLSDERVPGDVQKKVDTIIRDDVVASVRFIQTAVSRSSAIIDSLLRLSRAGRIEYQVTEVNVAGVVQRVIDAMASTIQQKEATLVVHQLLASSGDATAVEQIFGNLIGNAVNYLDPARPGRIDVGMINDGQLDGAGLRTYYVKDNGLGIPAAYLGKVFVAFQRLHGDIAKGEGIGLALVRRMIERHGGRAWVESEVGKGTTFFVALPAGGAKPVDTGETMRMATANT